MTKALIGPQLRQLRLERKQTQAEMARQLQVSPAYINLLEANQRALSVRMLMRLTEAYGVDWKDLLSDPSDGLLADLRRAMRDTVFAGDPPDLPELRAAVDHAPRLVAHLLQLHENHRRLLDSLASRADAGAHQDLLNSAPEAKIHDFFRDRRNYFPGLEQAAAQLREATSLTVDTAFTGLRTRLERTLGITLRVCTVSDAPEDLRVYDRESQCLSLSEALDHPNRVFQMAHVLALVEHETALDRLVDESRIPEGAGAKRLRVELANYLAAAVLMPYRPFLQAARDLGYDLDLLAARFGVSVEQVAHRLTTLQREGAEGVPFFFLRTDHAGNVTKRFNATSFQLAERGGACPRLRLHEAFLSPGRSLPQIVEMPDGTRFFTLSRTVDRPAMGHPREKRQLAIAIGCEVGHAGALVYARGMAFDGPGAVTPIGINCYLCPRPRCPQRAHQPVHVELPISPDRRGGTRYES